ncbi:MAG: hypothetical protein ACK42B_07170, partial [Chitinophagaceae bacterium]
MFNKSNSFGFLFFIVLLVACNRLPYQSTNRFYKKQTKELVKQIQLEPSLQIVNNLPAANQWVGTTNF